MDKHLLVSGMAVLLICVGLSGCNEQQPVEVQNISPTVEIFGTPQTGTYPLTVSFTSQCKNLDYEITFYFWSFGDGHYSTENNTTHTYEVDGTYEVTLQVSDINPYEEDVNTSNSKLDVSNEIKIVVKNDDESFRIWVIDTLDVLIYDMERLEYDSYLEKLEEDIDKYLIKIDQFRLSSKYSLIQSEYRAALKDIESAIFWWMHEEIEKGDDYLSDANEHILTCTELMYNIS